MSFCLQFSENLLPLKHIFLLLYFSFFPFLRAAGKEMVQQSYKEGTLDAFNGRDAPWGHGPTNTTKWVRLARPILYRVHYEPKYEPFIIVSRRLAPWADARFVGYGGNKIAYMNQLWGLSFGFHVHPYGFVIHVPHVRTRAANLFVLHKARGQADMEELRLEVETQVRKRAYVPVTDGCKKDLEEEGEEPLVEALEVVIVLLPVVTVKEPSKPLSDLTGPENVVRAMIFPCVIAR